MVNKLRCPFHGPTMSACLTRFGIRNQCRVHGCTVACWPGSTSTPADNETRDLRRQCHALFDPLWKPGPRRIFQSRGQAYAALKALMGTTNSRTHIGMFDANQCRKLLAEITAIGAPA